jgi:hypothetical protein
MSRIVRKHEIQKRRRRKKKLKKLKTKLAKAKGQDELQRLVEKIRKVSPFYPPLLHTLNSK